MRITVKALIPDNIPPWCDIFNHPLFYNLHKTKSSFYLSFFLEESLIGLCHFTEVEPGVYRSPFRGTYGNLSFKENLDLKLKYDCVDQLLLFAKSMKVKKVEIVSEPFSHNLQKASSFFNIYLNKSFSISNQEINHTLIVDEQLLIEKMMRNNKKRLNKCEREGFKFEKVSSASDIEIVYQTIQENREAKGYKVSMTLDQILKMYKVLPDKLYFFKATHLNTCAASSICIKLNNDVLYVFYWGNKQGFEQYSPVVYLANGIYRFAQQNQFKLIDAGTSSLHGEPNFGVATFKENLGFSISLKLTYSKEL
jgi:hypothetical protein